MNKKRLVLFCLIGLVILNPAIAEDDVEEAESRTIPLSSGDMTFTVEDGQLNISATVEAYPEASLSLNDSSDGEDYGPRENVSAETKEYELLFEKARGIESLYKTNITATKQIPIEQTTDILLKYRVSEAEREIRRMKSGTLVTVTPESVISVSKNNRVNAINPGDNSGETSDTGSAESSGTTYSRGDTAGDTSGQVNNRSPSQTLYSPVEIQDNADLEVSSEYSQELDEMSKKELKNRVIYLRKKVVKLERAVLGVSQSLTNVKDLVEADMESDSIQVESSRENQENRGFWNFIIRNVL